MSNVIKPRNSLKLKSPVFEFMDNLPSGIGKCKLCSRTGKRSDMTAHFLEDHQGTEEEAKIKMFMDNNKITKKLKEFESIKLKLPERLDTLHEDMINEMEDSWQCKVCGEEFQDKILMGKHVTVHFEEEYKQC